MLEIIKFQYDDEILFEDARAIRTEVFIIGQYCPVEDEFDEFDTVSKHFLVYFNKIPIATSRMRKTPEGIKFERFAVLEKYRGVGAAKLLIETMLEDVKRLKEKKYLYAQDHAVGLYEKFGFKKIGKSFLEVGIVHYKMVYEN